MLENSLKMVTESENNAFDSASFVKGYTCVYLLCLLIARVFLKHMRDNQNEVSTKVAGGFTDVGFGVVIL